MHTSGLKHRLDDAEGNIKVYDSHGEILITKHSRLTNQDGSRGIEDVFVRQPLHVAMNISSIEKHAGENMEP